MSKKIFKVVDGIAVEVRTLLPNAVSSKCHSDTKAAHYRAAQRDYDEAGIVSDSLPWGYRMAAAS